MNTFNKIISLTIVLLLILLVRLNAQVNSLEFSHITTEEGLSYNNITKVLQDRGDFCGLVPLMV